MVDIQANIREVQMRITRACERSHRSPSEITLVAITKGVEVPAIKAAFNLGIRDLARTESRRQRRKLYNLQTLSRMLPGIW